MVGERMLRSIDANAHGATFCDSAHEPVDPGYGEVRESDARGATATATTATPDRHPT